MSLTLNLELDHVFTTTKRADLDTEVRSLSILWGKEQVPKGKPSELTH